MTGIFSEVETEMGQERENTGKEGEERQGVPVFLCLSGARSTGHSQRSEGLPGLPTEAVGQGQQLHWSHSMRGYGQHPKAPWITQGRTAWAQRLVAWLCLTGEAGSGGGEKKRKWLLTRPFQAHLMVLG